MVIYCAITTSSFKTMSSICSAIDWTMNSDLIVENWAWVDQRLEEVYHGYGLTKDNCDDYIDAGLLVERWDWLDTELQNQYSAEFEDRIPCPAPIAWVLYKNYESQYCLEEERRSRAESDISDHSDEVERVLKRLDCQSPLLTGMFPIEYSHMYAVADEVSSVSSLEAEGDFEAESGVEDCSTINHRSETSSVLDWFVEDDVGYDSF